MKLRYLAISFAFFALSYFYSRDAISESHLLFLQQEAKKSPKSLKIMSYNIRSSNLDSDLQIWDNRKSKVIDLLRKYSPDILATQEGLRTQLKYIENSIPDYQGFGYLDDKPAEFENLVIFFNKKKFHLLQGGYFWLSETPKVSYSKSWDAMFPRLATYCVLRIREIDTKVFVINTHLDHKGMVSREKSVETIISYLKENIPKEFSELPVILMGDFNEAPHTKSYQLLQEREGFANLKQNCYSIFRNYKSSFHYYYGKIVNNPVIGFGLYFGFAYHSRFIPKWNDYHIDWVLTRGGASNIWKHIVFHMPDEDIDSSGIYASDHFPIFGIIELSPKVPDF